MAKKIQGKDIIQDNHLANAVKSAESLKKVYSQLDVQIKKTAKTAKAGLGGIDPNSAKGIRQINAEVNNSIKLRKAQIDINKKRQQLQREEIKTNELIANQTKKAIANKKKEDAADQKRLKTIRESNSAYKKQSKELADLSRRFKDLSIAGRGSGKVARGLLVDIKKLNAGLVKADAATGKFGRNVGNYPKTLGKATAGLKSFAGALGLTSGIFILAQGLKDAVKLIADFEQGNANLAAVLGDTKGGIKELTNDAKKLGSISAFTASQITGLQTELGKLGFNRKEILESTSAISELAAAVGSELAEAAIVAGATLGGFGLEAIETQRVVDVMAKSFSTTALDMEKFKESMKSAAPAAKAVGISVEQTTALLGTLANAGISGSRAGNNLKTTFINLNAAGLTLEEGLAQVANSQDKLGTATKLVGKNAAASFLVLSEGVETTAELTAAFENSGGAAKQMADTQLDTLSGSMTLLTSAYEGFILSLESGDGSLGKLAREAVEAATALLQLASGIEATDEVLNKFAIGEIIVDVRDFIDGFTGMFDSFDNFKETFSDFRDILIGFFNEWNSIITFGFGQKFEKDMFSAVNALEGYNAQQREAIHITALAQAGIKKLGVSVVEYTVKEQARITALAKGNLTQDQRNALIADLNDKYPELLENYDLENLSQEDAIRLNQELKKEIIDIAILKQKSLALTFLNLEVEKEQNKIAKITNANVKKQKLEELEFTKNVQLARIDAIELETRIRLGLAVEEKDELKDLSDDVLDNAEDNDGKRLKSFKETSEKIIDQAEIEEKRLFDLRTQRDEDVKANDKDNLAIVKKNDADEAQRVEKQNADQEKVEEQRRAKEKADEAKRQQQLQDSLAAAFEVTKIVTDRIAQQIEDNIEKSQIKINESETAVDKLQARADAGFVDAEQSIKAEKQKIANEKANIEKLEKRKRDLLIVVAGLELLSQKINSGDGNATSSASSELSGFISGLEGFYDGTDTTLGNDLSHAYAITGDKDTHIIKAHKDEYIIGRENSRKLHGMNQEQIVQGALMLKNGEFAGSRAVKNITTKSVFNDMRMVSAMNEVKHAIDNIQIPEHKFNYDAVTKMATETIRVGSKTTNTHRKIKVL